MATLRKQLEEAQRLKNQAKKATVEVEKAKIEAEKAKDEAKLHSYNIGIAKTKDILRAKVPAICQAYCAQTWEEALN